MDGMRRQFSSALIRRHDHFMWCQLHLETAGLMLSLIFWAAQPCVLAQTEQDLPDHPQPQQTPSHAPQPQANTQARPQNQASRVSAVPPQVDAPWPRESVRGDEKILMYQPQLETWEGDEVHAYAALSVETKGNSKPTYGVVWFTARTEVDKVNREVTFDNFQITRTKFPTMEDKEQEYQSFLQAQLPGKSRVISLDRLEAALAVAALDNKSDAVGLPVKNDPPRIIFATEPATLVLIDGPAKFKDVGGTDYQRVLNTRAFIVLDSKKDKYYLSLMDGWMESPDLVAGPWTYSSKIPKDLKEISKTMQEQQQQQSKGAKMPSLKDANKQGKIPKIYVSLTPTELLVTEGAPQFETVAGTKLEYVKNTTANIFRDPATSDFYVLLAGRWFRSKSLESGPWEFVNTKNLPEEFAKIPENSPKAGVLASIPGTPAAQEALIANSIPQTATINRNEAHLKVEYDGAPQFKPIEGTELQYAVNTATPVIRVADKNYYAVENAVWFVGPAPVGPWVVATEVPASIYAIPPSSPLHYVTYVKVYRSTPEVVNVGYTPGYYGTVVSSTTTTVVYGTGWYYPPYVGAYWYGAPYTYGTGVATTWSSDSGWSLTIGVGYSYGYPYYYPWWGPWGYYGPCCWGPAWGYGYGGYAAANVYGQWGNTAYAGTKAAWANPYTGNYGAASRVGFQNTQTGTVGVAGRGTNTNIYTGNTYGGRGAVAYNPTTGIVAGGGAGYAGNIYTGQGTAGRGGFAYNTNTGAGVAAGNNNVYAGKDGTVYRYDRQDGQWSQNSGSGWQPSNKPQPTLERQQQARTTGQQRAQSFSGMRAGGFRGGGGRRR